MDSGVKETHALEDRRGYQEWTTKLPDSVAKRVISKLFSNEDQFQIHKTLGLLSVCSFFYRYFYVFPTTRTLGFENSLFDHATMLVHLLLSTSSLIFHVIQQRIFSRPMIIWEEYRMHAIVFSTRCLSVYFFSLVRPFRDTIYERLLLGCVVLVHHVAADEITNRYGPKDKTATTVRVKDNHDVFSTIVLRFYAFYQFTALGSHLVPTPRLGDLGYNTLIAIQSSAFLMTLYRKGLIVETTHAFWYTFCLVLSMGYIYFILGTPLFVFKMLSVFFPSGQIWNKQVSVVGFVCFAFPTPGGRFRDSLIHFLILSPIPN